MAVAANAEITDLDRMRSDVANRRGPHEETVAIEFNAASIIVVMKAPGDRVALANEILAEDVRDVDVLMPRVETVEAAVRVLLQHRKIGAIELITIVIKRAKHARAEIVVGKNKTAEVGDKRLNTGTHGNEIVVRVEVSQFHFAKSFFKRRVPVSPICATSHVDVDNAVLTRVEIIRHAEGRRELDGPIARLERRVAVKQLEAELQRLCCRKLFRTPKKLRALRIDSAHARRCRRTTLLNVRRTDSGEDHEQLVAFDRVIALEDVLIVRIPPATALERNVATARAAIAVPIVFGKLDAPAIGSLASLRRGRGGCRRWREGNGDDSLPAPFDDDVFERVAACDRKVAVVFVFVE